MLSVSFFIALPLGPFIEESLERKKVRGGLKLVAFVRYSEKESNRKGEGGVLEFE